MHKGSIAYLLLFSLANYTPLTLANETSTPQVEPAAQEETSSKDRDIYDNKNKNPDDPTRINTKLGFAGDYNFESDSFGYSISGSIGLSEAQKINLRVHPDSGEWTLGGSWLFKFGIVNFNFGRSEYDDGSNFNNYSIGTFIPLAVFDIEPYGWQIFPMAGFNYTDGEQALTEDSLGYEQLDDYILVPTDSSGGYLGSFALKPITEKITTLAFAGASMGSNDYFGYWLGAGAGYKVTKRDSISLLGIVTDNNYGAEQKLILSYSHDFSIE